MRHDFFWLGPPLQRRTQHIAPLAQQRQLALAQRNLRLEMLELVHAIVTIEIIDDGRRSRSRSSSRRLVVDDELVL